MAPTLYDEKPELGDLIEVFRGTYQHWAVYIGDGFVVHLAPPSEVPGAGSSSMMSVLTEKALVKKEELWDMVGTDEWKINNSLDGKYQPREPHIIVREACKMVGQELPYCVFRGNCEHFVNELRYGKAESRQMIPFLTSQCSSHRAQSELSLAPLRSSSSSQRSPTGSSSSLTSRVCDWLARLEAAW